MLTTEEFQALEAILQRARSEASSGTAPADAIAPGDIMQLRPGSDSTWETSLLFVHKVDAGKIRGAIMRPHRGGCKEAWASYTPPQLIRVGRAPFPEPAEDIRAWCYTPPCAKMPPRSDNVSYRAHRAAARLALAAEQLELARSNASNSRRKKT
jgi:hypothetical protein